MSRIFFPRPDWNWKFLLFCWSTWFSLMHFGRPYSLRTRKLAKKPTCCTTGFNRPRQSGLRWHPEACGCLRPSSWIAQLLGHCHSGTDVGRDLQVQLVPWNFHANHTALEPAQMRGPKSDTPLVMLVHAILVLVIAINTGRACPSQCRSPTNAMEILRCS